ncbi:MAG TPA: ATP-binding protein [Kofleriaceae bacterium]|nr:ATP-binding protein [Kofleriaceae bacterium]
MKLRGRFTLTLALAALVPIALAAVITSRAVTAKYRDAYQTNRRSVEDAIEHELELRRTEVKQAVASLASRDDPLAGGILLELTKGNLANENELRRFRDQSGSVMRGRALDTLTITGQGTEGEDSVLISAHDHSAIHAEPQPAVRQRAIATHGQPYFAREKIMASSRFETILVVEAAQLARYSGEVVAVQAGKRFAEDVLASVRREGQVDARVVLPSGDALLPGGPDWQKLAKDPPIRVPLLDADNVPVAYIEAAVSDGGLDDLLWRITVTTAALAIGAIGAVILVGVFVARRTARDLDRLVEGSLAAARGDLDHRVPVRSKDEVGAVAAAFNFMMEDLKTAKERLVIAERIAAWQDIARRLAHEIKNPLTPIQMAMDTLRKSYKKHHPEFGEILDESTETVLEEADRLKRIVAEFSDFARMPKPEFQRVDLNDIVRSSLALYQGSTTVDTRLAPDLPLLDADKGQLTQVLLNLVENSRDAINGRDGGRIAVTTRRGDAGDRALLVVEDNGPGVPGELKDKVFAPYFTTKQTKGGTGLGLAIVHRIVSDHGGRITISDAPGGGARFTIELPLRNGTALLASRI